MIVTTKFNINEEILDIEVTKKLTIFSAAIPTLPAICDAICPVIGISIFLSFKLLIISLLHIFNWFSNSGKESIISLILLNIGGTI